MELKDRELLAALMKARKLPNTHLAARAKCGESFIRALKNGTRTSCTPELAFRICLELGLTDTSLLFASKVSSTDAIASTAATRSAA